MKHSVRFAAWLMMVCLLLAFVPACADVICTGCSRSVDTGSCAFCPYCGVKVETSVTIDAMRLQTDGRVIVQWSDKQNHAPYRVLYRYFVDDHYFSDAQKAQIYWNTGDPVNECALAVDRLAPGCDYWVIVEDKDGNLTREIYRAPALRMFEDFKITTDLKMYRKVGDNKNQLSAFSAGDLQSGESYGLSLRLNFSQLGSARVYDVMVVIYDTMGVPIVDTYLEDARLEQGWTNWGWRYYPLDWYFDRVEQMYGHIPAGTYTVQVFLGGLMAGEGYATVN